jgi:2-oxoglutarate ferredoxin oxidoreductase subunit delta
MTKFVTVDFDKCKGCWLCIDHCPSELFKVGHNKNDRGFKVVEMVNRQFCLGTECEICPDNALLKPDEKAEPTDRLTNTVYWLGNKLSKNILDRKKPIK